MTDQILFYLGVIKNTLSKPSSWCKGTLAQDLLNLTVSPDSPNACRFCLSGAIVRAVIEQDAYEAIRGMFYDHVQACGYFNILQFNDRPTTTHADVLKMIDAVIDDYKKRTAERPSDDF